MLLRGGGLKVEVGPAQPDHLRGVTLRGAKGRLVVSTVLGVGCAVGAVEDPDEAVRGLKRGLNGALNVLADLGVQGGAGGCRGGAGSAKLPGREGEDVRHGSGAPGLSDLAHQVLAPDAIFAVEFVTQPQD